MFESASLRHSVDKALYKREEAKLRRALLDAQDDLKLDGRFPVLILIAGVEGAGKSEMVNLLNEWMDPRHIATSAFGAPRTRSANGPMPGVSGAPCPREAASASFLAPGTPIRSFSAC